MTTGKCLLKGFHIAPFGDRVSLFLSSTYRPAKRLKPVLSDEEHTDSLEDDSDSSSSSNSELEGEASSDNDAEDDKQAMLAALEAHGRAMFASLNSPSAGPSKTTKAIKDKMNSIPSASSFTPARLEMHGFDDILSGESEEDSEFEEGEGFDEDDGDDGFAKGGAVFEAPNPEHEEEVVVSTVVFGGDASRPKTTANTKADFKRFMVRRRHICILPA